MSELPEYPDLDQLRHQARELHRAAVSGQPTAARRIGLISARVTLSAAQLALAREYGFSSWAKLKNEVGKRRQSAGGPRVTGPLEVPAAQPDAGSVPAETPVRTETPLRAETWVGNGSLTVRIGLSEVQDVDDEALGWLSRAYAQNAAGAKARPAVKA
jgi:hypothetical protein